MKTYEPRRNNECPNGLHAAYDPAKDPTQNECTCPWLIIQSSTPVQHLTSWNRRETENFIREVDRGYFDPPGYPKRTGSMFLSPAMQRLLDVAEKEPVAAALTLLAGSGSGLPPFDAIAWDAEDACLSLRVGNAGGWRRLWLGHANVDTITDQDGTTAGGANPVLLWADHPDTWDEIDLPHEPIASPRGTSDDVFAEEQRPPVMPLMVEVPAAEIDSLRPGNPVYDDLLRQAQAAGNGGMVLVPDALASGGVISQGVAVTVGEDGPPALPLKWSHSTMHVEEGVTDPDIEFLKARADEVVIHPAAYPPDLEAQVSETINNPDSRVRGSRPLPRRVPQVPSDIAEAAPWAVTRGGIQFPTDVPEDVFHAAQAVVIGDESSCPNCGQFLTAAEILGDMTTHCCALLDRCTCDIRGSAPDTYACPEHPAKPCSLRCTSYVHVTYTDDAKTEGVFRCEKNALHDGDHLGEGSTWPDGATHLTGVAPTRATCIRCAFVALDDVSLLAWNSPHGDETHAGCGGAVTLHEMPATDVV